MKQKSLVALCVAGWALSGLGDTSPVYSNYGTVNSPLNIDATVFINGGLFDLGIMTFNIFFPPGGTTPLSITAFSDLYDTQNTVYYTNLNSGFMSGSEGFNFYFFTNGFYYPAGYFVNRGEIDGFVLRVSATNVISSGILSTAGSGFIKIDGQMVDLTRGGFDSSDFGGASSIAVINSYGVLQYAGEGVNNHLDDKGGVLNLTPLDLPQPQSSPHQVLVPATFGNNPYFTNVVQVPILSFNGFAAFANTNIIDSSNILTQVIFVSTNSFDTNMTVKAGFLPFSGPAPGPNRLAVVEWSYPDYDIIRGTPVTNYFYLADAGATQTNFQFATNIGSGLIISPDNYTVSQGTNRIIYVGGNNPFGMIFQPVFVTSLPSNTPYTNSLLQGTNFVSQTVTNFYTAYSADVGSLGGNSFSVNPNGIFYGTATILNGALLDPTNQAGRVEVSANQLDLTLARMRTTGLLYLHATNLLSASGAILDSPLIKLDLGATNGTLIISNMIPETVNRLNGTISVWSGFWTNGLNQITTDATGNTVTNVINVKTHVMVVDHQFQKEKLVETHDITLHATNVFIADPLTLTSSFIIDADSLTLYTNITGSGLDYLSSTNFPHLSHLTNHGTIEPPVGDFFLTLPQPSAAVFNDGTILANGIEITVPTFANSGTLNAEAGLIFLNCQIGKLDGGQLMGAGDIHLTGSDIKVRNTTITGSTIFLNVTNRLSDGLLDVNSPSTWTCSDGFNMVVKAQAGDLLNTTINSANTIFANTIHVWGAENRGATSAGFIDNAAIGDLVLTGARFGAFTFQGTGTNSAMYVDYLDFENYATNYLAYLTIASNLTIYFANANLPVDQLDGQFNGHLRWVSSFAGPRSSTSVTLANGQVISVNSALVQSKTIDSDGDGIPNAYDPSPFDGVKLTVTVTNTPSAATLLSWPAAAQTVYQVQYSTNLANPTWQSLLNYTNNVATNRVVTVTDSNSPRATQRYYRVGYTP